jgi:hypothetical protein
LWSYFDLNRGLGALIVPAVAERQLIRATLRGRPAIIQGTDRSAQPAPVRGHKAEIGEQGRHPAGDGD